MNYMIKQRQENFDLRQLANEFIKIKTTFKIKYKN